jgi:hypothetical protein
MMDTSIESAIAELATYNNDFGDRVGLRLGVVISSVGNSTDVDFYKRIDNRCVSCRSPSNYFMIESWRLAIRIVGDFCFG